MNRLGTTLMATAFVATTLLTMAARATEDRDSLVRQDREKYERSDIWIYNDLESGQAQAKRTGQPLAVVFR